MLKKKALNRILISTIIIFIVIVFLSFKFLDNKTTIYSLNNYQTDYKEAIYTLNKDNYISKTYIYVNKELTTLDKVKKLIETMIKDNNKNALLPSYFKPILPSNTKINSVLLENKIIKIDFSKELLNITKDQEEQMIEAIVYTLTDIDDVNGVEISIDNELLRFVPNSKKELPTILTKDYGINKKYEIVNNKDITKVVLYFLGSENNYIPITKYVNDDREKIEIIMETLTNKYIFYDNLVSLLDNNLTLDSYDCNYKTCYLTFNEELYKLTESKQTEIYELVSSSVFANYDVESVVFLKNNEEILTKLRKNLE